MACRSQSLTLRVGGGGLLTSPASVLYPVFCLLLSAFFCLTTTPALSAPGPEPNMVQGGGWAATYGGDRNEHANSIQQTSDRGYIVAGEIDSFGAGKYDIWVLKLRSDGTVEWQKAYGGVGQDFTYSIQETSDGGYITVGWIESFGAGLQDLWVMKLGTDGTVEWQKTYGGGGTDEGYSIQQTRDGGYIVAGWTSSFGAKGGLWVLKLTPDGSFGRAQDKSIGPSCDFIRDTNISGRDSTATVKAVKGSEDSNVSPRDSLAAVRDTNASANFLCY